MLCCSGTVVSPDISHLRPSPSCSAPVQRQTFTKLNPFSKLYFGRHVAVAKTRVGVLSYDGSGGDRSNMFISVLYPKAAKRSCVVVDKATGEIIKKFDNIGARHPNNGGHVRRQIRAANLQWIPATWKVAFPFSRRSPWRRSDLLPILAGITIV